MSPRGADLDRVRAATLCLLNVERARRDLPSLRADDALGEVATAYSEKMVRRRFFGHVCPDGSTVVSRIRTRTEYLLRLAAGLVARREPRLGHGLARNPAGDRPGLDALRPRIVARSSTGASATSGSA